MLQEVVASPVAVVGVPHAYLGAVIACLVEDLDDLPAARRAADHLAAAQRPRWWCHVPRLPLTTAGKADHEALRRVVIDARAGRGPARLLTASGSR